MATKISGIVSKVKAKNEAASLSKKSGAIVLPKGSGAQGLGEAMQSSIPAPVQPTAQQMAAGNGSGGAYVPPVAKPVGLPQKQAAMPPPTTPVFGGAAMQQNNTTPNYLDTRNTGLATDYSKLGLKDVNAVYQELSKNADFANAADQDKQTTADAIWSKMSQQAGAMDPNAAAAQNEVKTDDIPKDTKEYATLTDAEQDNPWISTLSEVEKQAYSMMSETEKKQFINIGRNDLKNTATYVARWKEQRDFNQKQGNIATQQANLQNENAAIMDNQRIRQAKQQLGNLEKNIGYLGTMGSPGVSATKMTAIKDQYTEAEKVFTELQTMSKNQEELRKLGMEDLASRLDFQMKGLQDDLDDKVSKAMQESLAGLSAADIKNQLDTVEEIDAFRKNLITNLDSKIGGFMDDNIKARAFLIERFDVLAKDMKDQANKQMEADALFTKNANTVNVDMSTAQGFFVDGNGQPIISATTGQVIPMPQKPPMEPIFKDGQLITFTSGENGELIPHVQQVSKPAGKIETIYTTDERGNEVKQSVIMHEDGTYTPVSFGGGQSTTPTADVSGAITGSSVAPTLAANPANITQIADNMEPGKEYDCGDRGQCGEWFNDATGRQKPVGDLYKDKSKYVDKAINIGEPGMGVVFNPLGEYVENGHVGMLASGLYSKNGKKGYDVVSANYHGNEKLSKDFVSEDLIKSNGGFIPLDATSAPTAPQGPTDAKASLMDIYQILTESGMADGIAKRNARNLAAQGLTVEQVQGKYPKVADQQAIREFVTNVSTAAELFDKSNNKLTALQSVLNQPNVSGKSIEVALKSFVASIDNTAAMAGEVEQAKNAGTSKIEEINNMLLKLGDGNVSEKTRKKIIETVNTFATSTREAFDSYLDTKRGVLTKNYGEEQGKKLDLYTRNKSQDTSQYEENKEYKKDGKTYVKKDGKRYEVKK